MPSGSDALTNTAGARERRVIPSAYPWIVRGCGAVVAAGALASLFEGWAFDSGPIATAGLAAAGASLLGWGLVGVPARGRASGERRRASR